MVYLDRLFREHAESRAFRDLINLLCPVDGHVFQTKDGGYIAALDYRGIDAECIDAETLERVTGACRSAARVFDERFVVNSFLFKRSSPKLETSRCENPIVDDALRNRAEFLNAKGVGLYSYEAFLTVTLKSEWKSPRLTDKVTAFGRHSLQTAKRAFRTQSQIQALDAGTVRSLNILHQAVASFIEQTGDALNARLLTANEAFAFFRKVLNPDRIKAAAISLFDDCEIDHILPDSELECYRDHLRLDSFFIKTLTLKQLPSRTYSNVLGELAKIRADLLLVTEWSPIATDKALSGIRAKRRHAHQTKFGLFSQIGQERPSERELLVDDSKEAVVSDLGECQTAIEMRGVQLGEFSLTVVVLASSLEEAERATAEVMKVLGSRDGSLNEERYNGLNAFLAALPGGYPYNLRRNLLTNENWADMVPWFQPSEGERTNLYLRSPYLAAFETEDRSLYYFNPHVQDVGHTLLFGRTGAGKSFDLNFLITNAQQYNPYTLIFDAGGSYRWLTELMGGSYIQFGPNRRSFSINPFCLPPTPANLEFNTDFCKLLIESDGHEMTDGEERDLFEGIGSLYVLDADQRRFSTLWTTLPRPLGNRLKRWTVGEQYGSWFDNVEDTVSHARFQCIDFEGMERLGAVLEPLMFYLLHRANEVIFDESLSTVFKLAVVDEAWLFLKHPITQDYITKALRTWRKKNASMILSTQSLHDVTEASRFRPLLESCPTKLLLANDSLDADFYQHVLRLNNIEVEKVRKLIPKKQLLLKRDGFSKVLNLEVDPKSYWLFTTNPYEAKRRQELVNQVGLEAALDILKGEKK